MIITTDFKVVGLVLKKYLKKFASALTHNVLLIDMDTTMKYNDNDRYLAETALWGGTGGGIRGAEDGFEGGTKVFCKIFVKCRGLARYLLSLSLSLSLSHLYLM
jgi:hypothetical protein